MKYMNASPGRQHNLPFSAGNDAKSVIRGFWNEFPCLPPLVIAGVRHMKNVSKVKVETSARQATILARIIVKQSPKQ